MEELIEFDLNFIIRMTEESKEVKLNPPEMFFKASRNNDVDVSSLQNWSNILTSTKRKKNKRKRKKKKAKVDKEWRKRKTLFRYASSMIDEDKADVFLLVVTRRGPRMVMSDNFRKDYRPNYRYLLNKTFDIMKSSGKKTDGDVNDIDMADDDDNVLLDSDYVGLLETMEEITKEKIASRKNDRMKVDDDVDDDVDITYDDDINKFNLD